VSIQRYDGCMAVGTLVPVEEYLDTAYRPDCDYIDGKVVERSVGELSHALMQTNVAAWLRARAGRWRIKTALELRMRINDLRFRIPDVTVLSLDAPREEVVVTPPLLCIEILSPRDSLTQIWERTQDYLALGVPVCWIIDPIALRARVVTHDGLVEAKDGVLKAGEIEMPLAEVAE
jgi:Uma2 family endonuclease